MASTRDWDCRCYKTKARLTKDIHCKVLRNCLKGQFSKAEKNQHRFPVEKGKKWLGKQNHLEEGAHSRMGK